MRLKLLGFMLKYETGCCAATEAVLTWLNEYLSIGQQTVELNLIVLFVLIGLGVIWGEWPIVIMDLPFVFLVVALMAQQRRTAAVHRRMLRDSPLASLRRLMAQGFILTFIAGILASSPHRWLRDSCVAGRMVVWLVFQYVLVISDVGIRGRGRDLSLAKLKEMFGTEWVPRPEMIPR